MIDEKIKLIHFGNDCASGIVINDILKIGEKQLFQLGLYDFDDILYYLKEEKYEEIYNKSYLFLNDIKIDKFYSVSKNYTTFTDDDKSVSNKKYNFKFNHDYEVKNNEIINYDFIVSSFDEKIENFKKCLELENKIIFITFTNHDVKVSEMIDILKKKTNNWFRLVIFTSNKNLNYCVDQVELIYLDNEYYRSWFLKNLKDRFFLYEEIYNKLHNLLKSYIDLPVFEDTHYYKTIDRI